MMDGEIKYVNDFAKQRALIRIKKRMDAGEDLCAILGIDKKYEYYAKKVAAGIVGMSYTLYNRIMSQRA